MRMGPWEPERRAEGPHGRPTPRPYPSSRRINGHSWDGPTEEYPRTRPPAHLADDPNGPHPEELKWTTLAQLAVRHAGTRAGVDAAHSRLEALEDLVRDLRGGLVWFGILTGINTVTLVTLILTR